MDSPDSQSLKKSGSILDSIDYPWRSDSISISTISNGKLSDSTEPIARPSAHGPGGNKKISTTYALINLLKGMVGPGCFALPKAFAQAGLWTGFTLVFLLGIVSSICMIKLVECSQYLCKRNNKKTLDYGQMAEEAMKSSFPWLRPYSAVGRYTANAFIMLMQMGILCVYVIFIVDHAKEIVDYIWPNNTLNPNLYYAFALPALMVIISIRTIKVISIICMIGNVLITYCIVIILEEMARAQHYKTSSLHWISDVSGVTAAAGSILYALEGQALVLPLENKMKHPEDMKGINGVLVTGVNLVSLIYAAVGFFGYLTYGNDVKSSITLNLTNQPLDFSVKCTLLTVVYLSYLIQSFPVVEVGWTPFKDLMRSKGICRWKILCTEYAFRYGIVLITMGVAKAIPNLDTVISLVGTVAGMTLALILPPIIETLCQLPNWLQDLPRWKIGLKMGLNILYFVMGLFFLIMGFISNLQCLIDSSKCS